MVATLTERNIEEPFVHGTYGRLVKCTTTGMTLGQVLAIVDKYIQDHPDSWHYKATGQIYLALREACKQ